MDLSWCMLFATGCMWRVLDVYYTDEYVLYIFRNSSFCMFLPILAWVNRSNHPGKTSTEWFAPAGGRVVRGGKRFGTAASGNATGWMLLAGAEIAAYYVLLRLMFNALQTQGWPNLGGSSHITLSCTFLWTPVFRTKSSTHPTLGGFWQYHRIILWLDLP